MLGKTSEKGRASLIRKRSLVRVQAGPLITLLQRVVFCRQEERAGISFLALFTATVVQPERGPAHEMVPNAASIASIAESCMSGRTWE